MPKSSPAQIPVPARVLGLRLIDRVDYADAFAVAAPGIHAPGRLLEELPGWFMVPWLVAARLLFRAEVGPLHGPDRLLGWRVLRRDGELCVSASTHRGASRSAWSDSQRPARRS